MTIIHATNFSHPATAALPVAEALARRLGDRLLLVHVVGPAELGADLVAAGDRSTLLATTRATEELTLAVERLRARGVEADLRVLMGRPADAIVGMARAESARLVVLGSDARKSHLFVRSLPEQVVRDAPCPVLVTRGLPYPQPGLTASARLHLLVFVCGRPASDAALAWVKEFRRSVDCDLTFVEPYLPAENAARLGLALGPDGAEPMTLRPVLERDLRAFVGELPGQGEVRFRFRASAGDHGADIAAVAEELQPDLVITGIREDGHRDEGEALSGPTALRSIKLPVICVPDHLRPPIDRRLRAIRTVLVGTDLSDYADQVVPAAYALLRGTGGTLEICYVHERPDRQPTSFMLPGLARLAPGDKTALERRLADLAPPEAAAAGIETRTAVLEAAAAAEGLREEAERIGADVVVVASRGRTGVRRMLMGSVAAELIRTTRRPVLVMHPPAR